jgi:hypothetical protein
LGCSYGCSSGPDDASTVSRSAAASSSSWAEQLREPGVEVVLRALAQPHATVREGIGAHRLQYTADFVLAGPATEEPPQLDAPAVVDHAIHDELELVWVPTTQGAPPRFALRQSNDHDRGREIVVVDGNIHTSDLHRGWQHYPVETDLHERWLDEAQRAVHDVVELAAPRLRIEPKASAADDTVTLTLALAETTNAQLQRSGQVSRWRAGAQIEQVSGELVLDASDGGWRSATLKVQYALEAADGRMLRGSVRLQGRVEPVDPDQVDVAAPSDSVPLAERTRLHAERQELLDGLAAPR